MILMKYFDRAYYCSGNIRTSSFTSSLEENGEFWHTLVSIQHLKIGREKKVRLEITERKFAFILGNCLGTSNLSLMVSRGHVVVQSAYRYLLPEGSFQKWFACSNNILYIAVIIFRWKKARKGDRNIITAVYGFLTGFTRSTVLRVLPNKLRRQIIKRMVPYYSVKYNISSAIKGTFELVIRAERKEWSAATERVSAYRIYTIICYRKKNTLDGQPLFIYRIKRAFTTSKVTALEWDSNGGISRIQREGERDA